MYRNALYSPYGAYELKAMYQRNLFLGMLITLLFSVSTLAVAWIMSTAYDGVGKTVPPDVIITIREIPLPPSIEKKAPQVSVKPPQAAAPRVGIPIPVADEAILDEDVVIATRAELVEIGHPDIGSIGEGFGIVSDTMAPDYLPEPGVFVPVEIYPEMIYFHDPEYPRLAKQAGITGTVVVWVVVDEEGNVIDAKVYESSGTTSLDEAAVRAAYKNKFKPGIQNGRPV